MCGPASALYFPCSLQWLLTFCSPRDSDAYLRPRVSYKVDDHWRAQVGGNVFPGAERHTFFGQFANNTNIYAALRYGF